MGAAEALQTDLFPAFNAQGDATFVTTGIPRPIRAVLPRPWGLCVLGSGSGGNATVLRAGSELLLIDAGFGPRTTAKRLAQAGVDLAQLRAVCVTHFDTDHFRPTWVSVLVDLNIRVFCHGWHLPELARLEGAHRLFDAGLVESFETDETIAPMQGVSAWAFRCQHDRQGTIAYRFALQDAGVSVGYATDLGHAPPGLIEHLAGVDVLCIESNYDEQMTIHSSRPSFVNRRNLSDSGHLSNDQAFEAVQRVAARSPHGNPRRILLLHRSSQCNHPTKVRRCFAHSPSVMRRVTLTEQRRRTRWISLPALSAVRRSQLTLASSM